MPSGLFIPMNNPDGACHSISIEVEAEGKLVLKAASLSGSGWGGLSS